MIAADGATPSVHLRGHWPRGGHSAAGCRRRCSLALAVSPLLPAALALARLPGSGRGSRARRPCAPCWSAAGRTWPTIRSPSRATSATSTAFCRRAPSPASCSPTATPAASTSSTKTRTGDTLYRRPRLPALDGPSRLASFDRQFQAVTAHPSGPLLLYFTGHGGPAEDGGYDNNEYDMWGDDALTVRHLAGAHRHAAAAHARRGRDGGVLLRRLRQPALSRRRPRRPGHGQGPVRLLRLHPRPRGRRLHAGGQRGQLPGLYVLLLRRPQPARTAWAAPSPARTTTTTAGWA